MNNQPTKIVIIGGGISGLSAAWELHQGAKSPLNITVLEASDRWGGKILTQTMPGPHGGEFIVDAGPESFVTRKRSVWVLTRELKLEDRVIDPGGEARGTYVLDNGKPVAIPLGPGAFIRSRLISPRGKLRMVAEPFIPRKADDEDESLADFVTRRLGPEALDKFIGPVLGGIYNTNPDEQSILISSPIMREMERDYGGLFRGLIGRMRANRSQKQTEDDPPPSRFIGFSKGAEELVNTLVEAIDGDLRLNAQVFGIERGADGYQVHISGEEPIQAGAVILATAANAAARILLPVAPEASIQLNKIKHSNIGTISLAYPLADLESMAGISGLMIPRREGRKIDAVVYTSAKIPERAPQGYGLLRVFFGGGYPQTHDLSEEALVDLVTAELRELLGIEAQPLDYRLARWTNSYPQAGVGHLDLVAGIEALLPPGIYVTGSSYRGLAVPDCISQGREAAQKALQEVEE